MKTTAKFISASLATLLVSASAVTAFAAETAEAETKTPVDSVTLTKSYKLEVADMKSPAETFNKCSKNSPTSSGGEMNCTSEHICSKKSL